MLPDALRGVLSGVRVLALEQAVALPFATRHLAQLGAEVIRVQSYERARPAELAAIDLTRSKKQIGLDLAAEGAPELFLKLAANCDIVAHNFTPRVVRKFGIDYESVRAVKSDIIYVSLTGFGTTGPWGERPLFGPGAEAVGGHNILVGDPEGWPGRPGTGVYADDTCGLYAAMAMLAALDERERTGAGQHIDISLYETMVAHLGPVLAERSRGAEVGRVLNRDERFAVHGVFDTVGHDRHVAIAATDDQLSGLGACLGIDPVTSDTIAADVAALDGAEVEQRLQAAGIAVSITSDAHDNLTDPHLWERGYFDVRELETDGATVPYPHPSATWGGLRPSVATEPRYVGQDNEDVLARVGGLSPKEIALLEATGAIGSTGPVAPAVRRKESADDAVRTDRGELSRVDDPMDWRPFVAR